MGDINSIANDATIGVGSPSYTIDENHNRSSIHDRLVNAIGKLNFALDTLVTKIVMCESGTGGYPIAYGVEIAPGAALAVASNFKKKTELKTELITVRHEVIVSAGVFQSPQLVSAFNFFYSSRHSALCSSWYSIYSCPETQDLIPSLSCLVSGTEMSSLAMA